MKQNDYIEIINYDFIYLSHNDSYKDTKGDPDQLYIS